VRVRSAAHPARKHFVLLVSLVLILLVLLLTFFSSKTWDGAGRYSIVIQENSQNSIVAAKIAIFSIEPVTNRAIWLSIPPETLLVVPFGYGAYPAASVFNLGELDANDTGGELLARSIERNFGVAIDAAIIIPHEAIVSLPQSYQELINLKKNFFTVSGFFRYLLHMKSHFGNRSLNSLAPGDGWKLFWEVRSLRADQITYLDAFQLELVEPLKRPDDSIVYSLRTDRFDLLVSDLFIDHMIRSQAVSVAVVNASGQTNLASVTQRILVNLGVNVVSKSTAKETIKDRCTIRLSTNQKEPLLVKKLTARWGCSVVFGLWDSLAAVEIILGESFVKK